MEDAIMVEEAKKVDPCFSFVGVYSYSDCKDDVLRSFLEAGAEAVLPSVNELPTVLTIVKEGAQ